MVDYRVATAESLAQSGRQFDAVLALEIVEHVAEPAILFGSIGALVKPGGAFVGATLNRTVRSFASAVLGAEYLLGWLPRGTHDWRKFMRPSEFVVGLRRNGLQAFCWKWRNARPAPEQSSSRCRGRTSPIISA